MPETAPWKDTGTSLQAGVEPCRFQTALTLQDTMSPIFVPIIAIAFSLLNIAHFGTHIIPAMMQTDALLKSNQD